jgi:hypothetical protein
MFFNLYRSIDVFNFFYSNIVTCTELSNLSRIINWFNELFFNKNSQKDVIFTPPRVETIFWGVRRKKNVSLTEELFLFWHIMLVMLEKFIPTCIPSKHFIFLSFFQSRTDKILFNIILPLTRKKVALLFEN